MSAGEVGLAAWRSCRQTTLLLGAWGLIGAVRAQVPVANLLTNPGFEAPADADGNLAGWRPAVGKAPSLVAEGAHGGDRLVRLNDDSTKAGINLESARLPARPGGLYRAAVWMRTGDNGSPGLYINIYDDVGNRIHHVFRQTKGPTAGWVRVEVSATAPVESEQVSVSLYAYIGDVGVFDFDDVELTVEGGAAPGSGALPPAQPSEQAVADIGSRLELFTDSYLIDGVSGAVVRRLHSPQPREVALALDQPWEGPTSAYFTAMVDGPRVRLYYRGLGNGGEECACTAESADGGITFTRPSVDRFEFQGSKANNIVWLGPGSHNFTPFRDANPAAPADQRYKAVAGAGPNGTLVAFASPDGYAWRKVREEPIVTAGAFDSQNLAFWDSSRQQYACYFRVFRNGVRDISRCTSPDFLTWTDPEPLDYGAAPAEHLYTNAILPYFRAPDLYLGFPCRFVPGRKAVAQHKEDGINDGVLMSSRDGLHFERWPEAFLRPPPDPECWTDRNNYIAWGLVPVSETEIALYWTEHYRHPTCRLRRGVIRTDGFVSVGAGMAGSELLTRPLVFQGRRLVVNVATSATGSARFELCDVAGQACAGFAAGDAEKFFGNEIAHTVRWTAGEDVSSLAGKPVRLRVRLKDADLYSFRFAE